VIVLGVGSVALPGIGIAAMMTACGFIMGATQPSRDLLVRASATRGGTGRVFGFVYSGLDVGSALAPLVIGMLLDDAASREVFWFIAVALAMSVGMALALRRAAPVPVAAPAE
jgi:hypothetical protein